jgi:acetyl esterase
MASTRELSIPTKRGPVRLRIYDPQATASAKPVFVYLHGGGWTLFSIDTHDRVMREYAQRAGVAVVGVDYALAPEAPFPAALEQVVEVVQWLASGGGGPGIDSRKIAIGGDSAGGNLSVCCALVLRQAGQGDLLKALLLIYGGFDNEPSPEADRRFGGPGYMLTPEERVIFWRNYVPDPKDMQNPLARPILADLRGLPPAMLVVGECDILIEHNRRMAERFEEAGVPVRLNVYAGATHSFIEAMSTAEVARRALQDSSDWLAHTLTGGAARAE